MAKALILRGLLAEFPTILQGILEPNLIPSREFESRSREFGALPEIPTPARLCGVPFQHVPTSTMSNQRNRCMPIGPARYLSAQIISEARLYSRLRLGGHQIERIQKNAASPRWGWSGVREIVPPLWSEAELRRVAGLLPIHQSSIENIVAELLAIGGRYHRNLHQDEFGPTRAERMQALRDLLVRLGVLSSRLEALPPQLQLLLLIGEVCAAADAILPLLWNLDTTTDGDVVIDTGSAGPMPADNSADPLIAVCAPVRRLRSRFELALTHLRRRKGPEARLHWACWSRNFAISGDERAVGPSPPTPSGLAPTRAAHNQHPDASCARRLKLTADRRLDCRTRSGRSPYARRNHDTAARRPGSSRPLGHATLHSRRSGRPISPAARAPSTKVTL
jgi:hypothetical protein